MKIRNLTCIGCPMGCPLIVKLEDTEVISIEGYTCKRGAVYGKKEVTNPTRIVTTTIRVSGGTEPVVSVHIGDVILRDVAHTGVDMIATKNVEI